jgi:hypothetical protein
MTAKFPSQCRCGNAIKKGDRMFYYPNGRTALCQSPCGEKAAAEFQSHAADEAMYSGGTY